MDTPMTAMSSDTPTTTTMSSDAPTTTMSSVPKAERTMEHEPKPEKIFFSKVEYWTRANKKQPWTKSHVGGVFTRSGHFGLPTEGFTVAKPAPGGMGYIFREDVVYYDGKGRIVIIKYPLNPLDKEFWMLPGIDEILGTTSIATTIHPDPSKLAEWMSRENVTEMGSLEPEDYLTNPPPRPTKTSGENPIATYTVTQPPYGTEPGREYKVITEVQPGSVLAQYIEQKYIEKTVTKVVTVEKTASDTEAQASHDVSAISSDAASQAPSSTVSNDDQSISSDAASHTSPSPEPVNKKRWTEDELRELRRRAARNVQTRTLEQTKEEALKLRDRVNNMSEEEKRELAPKILGSLRKPRGTGKPSGVQKSQKSPRGMKRSVDRGTSIKGIKGPSDATGTTQAWSYQTWFNAAAGVTTVGGITRAALHAAAPNPSTPTITAGIQNGTQPQFNDPAPSMGWGGHIMNAAQKFTGHITNHPAMYGTTAAAASVIAGLGVYFWNNRGDPASNNVTNNVPNQGNDGSNGPPPNNNAGNQDPNTQLDTGDDDDEVSSSAGSDRDRDIDMDADEEDVSANASTELDTESLGRSLKTNAGKEVDDATAEFNSHEAHAAGDVLNQHIAANIREDDVDVEEELAQLEEEAKKGKMTSSIQTMVNNTGVGVAGATPQPPKTPLYKNTNAALPVTVLETIDEASDSERSSTHLPSPPKKTPICAAASSPVPSPPRTPSPSSPRKRARDESSNTLTNAKLAALDAKSAAEDDDDTAPPSPKRVRKSPPTEATVAPVTPAARTRRRISAGLSATPSRRSARANRFDGKYTK